MNNLSPSKKAARARYRATPKGKASRAKYFSSPKGRAMQARKNASEKGKARTARYNASEKGKAHTAAYRASPEARAIRAKWLATPEAQTRRCEYHRIRMYGLNDVAYLELFERQGGKCGNPACLHPLVINTRGCHVDHCHRTGRVRGLLCGRCNIVLGFVEGHSKRIVGLEAYLRSQGLRK